MGSNKNAALATVITAKNITITLDRATAHTLLQALTDALEPGGPKPKDGGKPKPIDGGKPKPIDGGKPKPGGGGKPKPAGGGKPKPVGGGKPKPVAGSPKSKGPKPK
jgi:hypothetical protein